MPSLADKTRQEWLKAAPGELAPASEAIISQIEQLENENEWLKEQFRLAKARQFGPSSEQTAVGQEPNLFNEAEACADLTVPEPAIETVTYTRRKAKGQREAKLADLPVEDIDYRLPDEQQVCPQCESALHEMGTEVRQELKIVPAKAWVVNHIRHKYACRECYQDGMPTPVVAAAMPIPAFPNSFASASAVAYIMNEKTVMSCPLYRLEQQFKLNGIDVSRQTMANWMIKGAAWLQTVYNLLHVTLIACDIVQADDTRLQVLREAGRAATTNSCMWVYRTGRIGPAIVLFDYVTTRAGEHPKRFLAGFEGYLTADGHNAYDCLPNVVLSGCWAHARRKFDEAIKCLLGAAAKTAGNSPAHAGLAFCNRIFQIERGLKDASTEERFLARNERSRPLLGEFKTWLDAQSTAVISNSALGKAIGYCNNQWDKLTAFLLDGRLEIDNNRSERSIKSFVIGRKNWMFANTPAGATSSAIIYSIVETAKENGVNPLAYLEYLFETLPNIDRTNSVEVAQLLPWSEQVQEKCASKSAKIARAP